MAYIDLSGTSCTIWMLSFGVRCLAVITHLHPNRLRWTILNHLIILIYRAVISILLAAFCFSAKMLRSIVRKLKIRKALVNKAGNRGRDVSINAILLLGGPISLCRIHVRNSCLNGMRVLLNMLASFASRHSVR